MHISCDQSSYSYGIHHVTKAFQAMKGTDCCCLYPGSWYTDVLYIASLCDLKATQMNMQCSLIQKLIVYKSELGHKAAEATKHISCTKCEGAVDHRWFKKFCSGCKIFNDQARSGRPKTMDSKSVLQAIVTNPVSSSKRVPGKFGISQSSVVHHLCEWSVKLSLILPKYYRTFESL